MTYAERIEKALWKKFTENRASMDQFTLDMKAEYTLRVERCWKAPYKSCGHWHGRSAYFKVTNIQTGEEKSFKGLDTLAKAIAGHIV
ncbi:MAG: hypothetical protein LIO54_08420 [Oscillospiraceae bacterium]|nr:hypothetical protein [Oscillospiraceae bacterium]